MIETGVGVLDKSMSILYLLEGDKKSLSVQEIVEGTGFPLPTVYRLINAMVKHGLLSKDQESISLGSTIMALGAKTLGNTDLYKLCLPYLEELNILLKENVNLNISNKYQRVVVQALKSSRDIGYQTNIGDAKPVFSGAAGKIFMSYIGNLELKTVLKGEGDPIIDQANSKAYQKHEKDLHDIRMQGYALSLSEQKEGVVAIAVPIVNYSEQLVAVLTVVAPENRMNGDFLRTSIEQAQKTALTISKKLGYRE